jgi:hypothetical protein
LSSPVLGEEGPSTSLPDQLSSCRHPSIPDPAETEPCRGPRRSHLLRPILTNKPKTEGTTILPYQQIKHEKNESAILCHD